MGEGHTHFPKSTTVPSEGYSGQGATERIRTVRQWGRTAVAEASWIICVCGGFGFTIASLADVEHLLLKVAVSCGWTLCTCSRKQSTSDRDTTRPLVAEGALHHVLC